MPGTPFPQRFWSKVDKSGGCWLWMRCTNKAGYGQVGHNGKVQLAHRVAWKITNGEIPEGLCILHKCDNPPCCNPDHLFLGTKRDNTTDMVAKGRARGGSLRGEANGRGIAKLTEADVHEIRQLLVEGVNQRQIGRMFCVRNQSINAIKLGKSWSWLKENVSNNE